MKQERGDIPSQVPSPRLSNIEIAGVLAFFLALTALIFWQSRSSSLNTFHLRMDADAFRRSQLIVQRLDSCKLVTSALQQYYEGSESVTREEFTTFIKDIINTRPDIEAMIWAPAVPRTKRTGFEEKNRNFLRGRLWETTTNGVTIPAKDRLTFHPVLMFQSTRSNLALIGFDLGSVAAYERAMIKARDRDEIIVAVNETSTTNENSLFALFAPVYAKGKPNKSPEERQAALEGFAIGIFRTRTMMQEALYTTEAVGFDFALLDITKKEEHRVIHHLLSRRQSEPVWRARMISTPQKNLRILPYAGSQWGIMMTANNYYLNQNYPGSYWLILPLGMGLTAMIYFYLHVHRSRQREMEEIIHQRTSDLQAANLELNTEIRRRIQTEYDLQQHKKTLEDRVHDIYAPIIRHMQEVFFKATMDGRITFANPAAARLLGYDDEKNLVGLKLDTEIWSRSDQRDRLRHTLSVEDSVSNFIMTCRNRDGTERMVEFNFHLERDKQGRPSAFEGVGRDVTDRHQQEEARIKLLDEVARSNKELETFAYVASHDLQEPLRLVAAHTQLLVDRHKDKFDPDSVPQVGFILSGVSRMQQLIEDLLTYSRISNQGHPLKIVPSGSVLQRVTESLQLLIAETKAEIIHGPLPDVTGDPTQLGQLFQNLVGNAIKFRREGVTPRIEINAVRDGNGFWEFSIKDNGIGIAPEHYERIFVIFQRLHSRRLYSGTGIGLAICKRIVERHGGRIWIESTPGEGSVFHFTLPPV